VAAAAGGAGITELARGRPGARAEERRGRVDRPGASADWRSRAPNDRPRLLRSAVRGGGVALAVPALPLEAQLM